MVQSELTPKELEELHQILLAERSRLTRNARELIHERINNQEALPADIMDVSTDLSMQTTHYRLRDREKFLLQKIHQALQRIEEGTYGHCDECDEPIGYARLKARPVAALCIDCKEEQERAENNMADKRAQDDFEFTRNSH
jgi:DnaK suppressor protein